MDLGCDGGTPVRFPKIGPVIVGCDVYYAFAVSLPQPPQSSLARKAVSTPDDPLVQKRDRNPPGPAGTLLFR